MEKMQAYRASYNETVAPPGGPLSRVIRPPIDQAPESKRAQLIEEAEYVLEEEMEALKEAAHEYNVEFQKRIDAVKARGVLLETKIDQEENEMEISIQKLQQEFQKTFQQAFLQLENKMYAHFTRVETQEIAPQEKKIKEYDQDARMFYFTRVPEIMEASQGTITRQLEKNHETFDIENAKIQKREKKTLNLFEIQEKKMQFAFETEKCKRLTKFQELEEEFHHQMKMDNRESERSQTRQVQIVVDLKQQFHQETKVRTNEDMEILDQIGASFHRLQSSILENLGEEKKKN